MVDMEDDELMKKIEHQVNKKKSPGVPKRKKKKKENNYKLWEQLNEETLRKLGYIK